MNDGQSPMPVRKAVEVMQNFISFMQFSPLRQARLIITASIQSKITELFSPLHVSRANVSSIFKTATLKFHIDMFAPLSECPRRKDINEKQWGVYRVSSGATGSWRKTTTLKTMLS